jgi:hypothetical protein
MALPYTNLWNTFLLEHLMVTDHTFTSSKNFLHGGCQTHKSHMTTVVHISNMIDHYIHLVTYI